MFESKEDARSSRLILRGAGGGRPLCEKGAGDCKR
jgi:hypothetical protein